MRLINTKTLELEQFIDHRFRPEYVILSHTWHEDEVLYADLEDPPERLRSMKGWRKIAFTCRQAFQDRYQYAWVDTCCIDKSSSTELAGAINAMYAWYAEAKICYVYLADVDAPTSFQSDAWKEQFRQSRWFKRGWTLQELIAPRHVRFYSKDWVEIGPLENLIDLVSTITGIPALLLGHETKPADYCIANRLSWAANRTTDRLEDEAYCLLGIFGVSMSLLYGERENAFIRLQERIMQESADLTILAWDWDTLALEQRSKPLTGRERYSRNSLLASRPSMFEKCGQLRIISHPAIYTSSLAATSIGLGGRVLLRDVLGNSMLALGCFDARFPSHQIVLATTQSDRESRHGKLGKPILTTNFSKYRLALMAGPPEVWSQKTIVLEKDRPLRWELYGKMLRVALVHDDQSLYQHHPMQLTSLYPSRRWDTGTLEYRLPARYSLDSSPSGLTLVVGKPIRGRDPIAESPSAQPAIYFEIEFAPDPRDEGSNFSVRWLRLNASFGRSSNLQEDNKGSQHAHIYQAGTNIRCKACFSDMSPSSDDTSRTCLLFSHDDLGNVIFKGHHNLDEPQNTMQLTFTVGWMPDATGWNTRNTLVISQQQPRQPAGLNPVMKWWRHVTAFDLLWKLACAVLVAVGWLSMQDIKKRRESKVWETDFGGWFLEEESTWDRKEPAKGHGRPDEITIYHG